MKYDLDNVYITDIETTGLLDVIKDKSDFHVLSVAWKVEGRWKIKSTNKEEDIKKLFENPHNTIVGHFFLGYDLPALKIMFPDINFQAKIIDSLSLSHYLYNERLKHGLEEWGIEFGYEKVKISAEEWIGIGKEGESIIKYYEEQRRS